MSVAAPRDQATETDLGTSSKLNAFWMKVSKTDPLPNISTNAHNPPTTTNPDFIAPKKNVKQFSSVTFPDDQYGIPQVQASFVICLPMTDTRVQTLLQMKEEGFESTWTVALGWRYTSDTGLEIQTFARIGDLTLQDVDGELYISGTATAKNGAWKMHSAA